MTELVQLAVVATISPLILAVVTRYLNRSDKREDWARQDAVASRVAAAAVKVEKVAKTAAKNQSTTDKKLDDLAEGQREIHTLVNSNMTATMQDSHDSTVRELIALREITRLTEASGATPDPATAIAIEMAEAKVAELEVTLSAREEAQSIVEQQAAQG